MQNPSWNDIMGGIKLREENLIFKPKLCQMMLVYIPSKTSKNWNSISSIWIGCNKIDKSCQIKNIISIKQVQTSS